MANEGQILQGNQPFQQRILGLFTKNPDMILAAGVLIVMALLLVPLPPFLLDILLALNITVSVLTLLIALYLLSPLDFSSFPTILLITTLFRMGLNVASTRLILGQGYAGNIIESFGSFVIQGNYIVGFIIFLILVIINFIVIIKGSTRIAEVTARFTLDALPGKQMSIDADLNAGYIDEETARKRRESLTREADFFGSMDYLVNQYFRWICDRYPANGHGIWRSCKQIYDSYHRRWTCFANTFFTNFGSCRFGCNSLCIIQSIGYGVGQAIWLQT